MKRTLQHLARGLLSATGLGNWPVRVRGGVAAGARWTLFPWSAYWRGNFESNVQQAIIELGDIRGWTCWDLGAHFGIYSVGLARRVGPTGQVIAFEPNPFSYRRLERHRTMNGLTWMKAFEAASSDVTGMAEFYTYGEIDSTTTHLPYEGEARTAATTPIQVRCLTLDELVAQGVSRLPDFVKIDVEGHAHKALHGARDTIAQARPILIVALHSTQEAEGVDRLLRPLGYTSARLDAASAGDTPIGHDFIYRCASREESRAVAAGAE